MSVTLLLEDDFDDAPERVRELTADVCWMADAPLRARSRYTIAHHPHRPLRWPRESSTTGDIHSPEPREASELGLNDIGRVHQRLSEPPVADPYSSNRHTGSFVLIDESTNDTVGAGMIVA